MPAGEVAVKMNALLKPAYKHGAYTFLVSGVVPCNKCPERSKCDRFKAGAECEVLLDFQELKVSEIMALPHIKPEDELLVRMLVRELALQAVIAKYLAVDGMVEHRNGRVLPQPVMKVWYVSVNSTARMCEQLGLTPQSRARLKVGGGSQSIVKMIEHAKEAATIQGGDTTDQLARDGKVNVDEQ
jgi:hypothetical protein